MNKMTFTSYPPIVHVNSVGNPIGPVSYQEAHPKGGPGILHATTNLLVFQSTSHKNVLLSLRSAQVNGKGKYDSSAGGHLDWIVDQNRAQTPLECMKREAEEELFYQRVLPKDFMLTYKGIFTRTSPEEQEISHLYSSIYTEPFFPNPNEVSTVEFVNIDDLIEEIRQKPDEFTQNLECCLRLWLQGEDRFLFV